MTLVTPMHDAEVQRIRILPEAGLGALHTERGNLPLDRLDVRAKISGLVARTTVTTEFLNAFDTPLEATYVFPLPDRGAVTGMTMTADGRTVEAELRERGAARQAYDQAVSAGQRASIAEEDRPDVFSMRVGNILPGERVTVALTLVGPLPWEDGAATFRFPLVVAPRYIPGTPLPGAQTGDGQGWDTDAVPDASRITPPVLLPGFPNPLRLSVAVEVDPAGLSLAGARSSLHTVTTRDGVIEIAPGERADRDFVLRLPYTGNGSGAVFVPDADGEEGTLQVTVLPPDAADAPARPKDVVLLLDRSGSMGGWKMVAARRAAARVVDTLTAADRFAVLTFDTRVERPADLGEGLAEATDRHRFRAVEHLARVEARGGTELLAPLRDGLRMLADQPSRDRVLVLVTDGQVGNEDQILAEIATLAPGVRIHTVGIDRAVNAGFLARLAGAGAGRCELVESEDRLDEAMTAIHRRIGAPLVTGIQIQDLPGVRDQSLFPGVPLVLRARTKAVSTVTVTGRTRDDAGWRVEVPVQRSAESAVTAQWARARLRELEDRYAAGDHTLEQEIVSTSLRHGVLCRFTAWLAVDTRVVTEGGVPRRVTQPVESPSGWSAFEAPPFAAMPPAAGAPSFGAALAPQAPGRTGGIPRASGGAFRVAGHAAGPDAVAPPAPAAMPPGAPGVRRSFAPASFAAPKASAPGGGRAAAVTLDELAGIVRTEADRLRAAADRSALERRDLLEDLATRLGVLLTGHSGAEVQPLQDLVARLGSGITDLSAAWTETLGVLEAFAPGEPERRRAFWK